jgi:hypothetical protein
LKHIWTKAEHGMPNQRAAERRQLAVPARLTWKDARGTTRFATVMTRDISQFGVYVEAHSPIAIPLYRLVQFQLDARDGESLPAALQGRVLSAVYRVSPPSASQPQGLALRLLVDPRQSHAAPEPARATA